MKVFVSERETEEDGGGDEDPARGGQEGGGGEGEGEKMYLALNVGVTGKLRVWGSDPLASGSDGEEACQGAEEGGGKGAGGRAQEGAGAEAASRDTD